jgi:hypothetical protein
MHFIHRKNQLSENHRDNVLLLNNDVVWSFFGLPAKAVVSPLFRYLPKCTKDCCCRFGNTHPNFCRLLLMDVFHFAHLTILELCCFLFKAQTRRLSFCGDGSGDGGSAALSRVVPAGGAIKRRCNLGAPPRHPETEKEGCFVFRRQVRPLYFD